MLPWDAVSTTSVLSSLHDLSRRNNSKLGRTKARAGTTICILIISNARLKKSKVFICSINELRDDQNPYDIDFQPSTLEEGINFNATLNTELGYWQLPANGTVHEKCQRLHSALEVEQIYELMTKLVTSIDHESAFCAVEDAISCIMHGGSRINEKLFMMVLLEAWNACMSKQEQERLIITVENYSNSGVFGTAES